MKLSDRLLSALEHLINHSEERASLLIDGDNLVHLVNPAMSRVLAKDGDLAGKQLSECLDNFINADEIIGHLGTLQANEISTLQAFRKTSGGDISEVAFKFLPVFEAEYEQPVEVLIQAVESLEVRKDAKDYAETLSLLKESQRQLNDLANNVPGALIQYKLNPDGTDELLYASDQVSDLWEVPKEKIYEDASYAWVKIIEEDLPGMRESVLRSAETGEFWDHSYRIRKSNGELKWLNGKGQPVRQSDGSVIWNTLILDLTELYEKEEALRVTNSRMSMAADSAGFGVWDYDFLSGELSWDDTMLQLYGYTRENFAGVSEAWESRLHPEDKEEVIEAHNRSIEEEGIIRSDFRILLPSGEIRYIAATGKAITGPDGKAKRVIGINQDITERKLFEQRLRISESEARAASEAKSDFLNMVNHELRTPLNSILGPIDLLETEELSETGKATLELIKPAANHLLDIINDILSLSKLQTGNRQVQMKEVILGSLVSKRLGIFEEAAKAKGISFNIDVGDVKSTSIVTDATAVTQILYNLVSNAVKFTDTGGVVRITIRKVEQEGAADSLCISVIDTGCGISERHHSLIFEAFQQVEMGVPRPYEGTGLGLAIAKELTQLVGGALSFKSEAGKGSTFTLCLPADPTEKLKASSPKEKEVIMEPEFVIADHVNKVLVVEDDDGNTRYMKLLLDKLGLDADYVTTGSDAIFRYKSAEYDVVLMDIRLPDIRGDKVVELLLKMPKEQHARMIACTAFATDEFEHLLMTGDFDGFLGKPLGMDQLKSVLKTAVN